MSPANASSRYQPHGRGNQRLGIGVAMSVLLHALLLSLQFGLPGGDPGGGKPIALSLAPAAAQTSRTEPDSEPLPAARVPLPASAPETVVTVAGLRGLRLVDPVPAPPVAAPVAHKKAKPKLRKRSRPTAPRRSVAAVSAPVIVADTHTQTEFTVPLPEIDVSPETSSANILASADFMTQMPETLEERAQDGPEPSASVEGIDEKARAEALRLAAEEEERRLVLERERLAEEERVAREYLAQRQAELQAQQRAAEERLAEEHRILQLAQQQREDRRVALERSERMRRHEQEELARREAAQRRAEEAAAQEAQLLARERAEQEQRLAQEQAARERSEQQEQRRLLDERAHQLAQERARSERLARQQAEQASSRATDERKLASVPGFEGEGGASKDGADSGEGVRAEGGGSRARELLRGVTIPGFTPPTRSTQPQPNARRVVADGTERDVPLRLYVDSVRQKLERNAVLGGARFALRTVRTDPLVSLSLRSDGSVEDVIIVRSSGRPDTDEAVRRIVHLNARYAAFPPNVAARFDIIEVRRVWSFTDVLKLMEEMR